MPLNVLQLSQMRRRLRYHLIDGVICAIAAICLLGILWRLAL